MTDNKPDMIAQVGEMLKRIADGGWATKTLGDLVNEKAIRAEVAQADDRTIVLASAMLAIAGELREVNNSLKAAMPKEPDAD